MIKNHPMLSNYLVLSDSVLTHDACNTRRRPDILLSSCDIHIIIECDEKQHRSYIPDCEWGRMDELLDEFNDLNTVVFIRWNPDHYDLKKVPKKYRPLRGKKDNRKERLRRLRKLLEKICSGKRTFGENIHVIYMYYDKDNENIAKRWTTELLWWPHIPNLRLRRFGANFTKQGFVKYINFAYGEINSWNDLDRGKKYSFKDFW
jgi:hypothetical protein